MALTRETEMRLRKAKLIEFFEGNRNPWRQMGQKIHNLLRELYAPAAPRPDDVAQYLAIALSGDNAFNARLDASKLSGKLWYSFFAELIIDRDWDQIRGANQ